MLSCSSGLSAEGTSEYKPVEGKIMTRWAGYIDPEKVLPEYLRTRMVRSDWCNLNGLWDEIVRLIKSEVSSWPDGDVTISYGATCMPGQFLPRSRPGQCILGERVAGHHQRSRRYTPRPLPSGVGEPGQASASTFSGEYHFAGALQYNKQ